MQSKVKEGNLYFLEWCVSVWFRSYSTSHRELAGVIFVKFSLSSLLCPFFTMTRTQEDSSSTQAAQQWISQTSCHKAFVFGRKVQTTCGRNSHLTWIDGNTKIIGLIRELIGITHTLVQMTMSIGYCSRDRAAIYTPLVGNQHARLVNVMTKSWTGRDIIFSLLWVFLMCRVSFWYFLISRTKFVLRSELKSESEYKLQPMLL